MDNPILQRVKEIIIRKNLSENQFCKAVGIGQPTLNASFNRNADLKSSTLTKILVAFPEVSAEWLMRGKGEMFIDNNAGTTITINNTKHSGTGDAISGNNIMANNKVADEKYYRDIIAEKESIIAEKDKRITELTDTLIKMALK